MIVAVERGLHSLARAIENRGHVVVPYGKYKGHADAVVYKGADLLSVVNSAANHSHAGHPGVLMINAKEFTIAEILNTLERRTYTSLF